jgi:hypothetical protein
MRHRRKADTGDGAVKCGHAFGFCGYGRGHAPPGGPRSENGGWILKMENSPQSPSCPSAPPLTAQTVFASWPFDFGFLMEKAYHELELSMTEGAHFFFSNALNFSVTIQAIADHLWHTGAKRNSQWNNRNKFVQWIQTQNDCIGIFFDLSNTYKHTQRKYENHFIARFENMTFPEDWVASRPPVEMSNRIIDKSSDMSLWPVVTKPDGWLVYYCYAAKSALHYLCENHSRLTHPDRSS